MGPSDKGMRNVREVHTTVLVGDGKKLKVTKVGDKPMTVRQVDGSTMDIVIEGYKCVPDLKMPLFGVLKAAEKGWKISSMALTLFFPKASTS